MIKHIIDIDKNIFLFLNNLGSETWDFFWLFISNKIVMFTFLGLIVLFYYYKYEGIKGISSIIYLMICVGLTDFIHVHLFKNLFMRLRPCWDPEILSYLPRVLVDCAGEYGFVSGHAANSAAIITFFLLSFKSINRFVRYTLLIWVFLIAYSRIYLGKHYPLDVIFGVIFGCFMGFFLFKIYNLYIKKKIIK